MIDTLVSAFKGRTIEKLTISVAFNQIEKVTQAFCPSSLLGFSWTKGVTIRELHLIFPEDRWNYDKVNSRFFFDEELYKGYLRYLGAFFFHHREHLRTLCLSFPSTVYYGPIFGRQTRYGVRKESPLSKLNLSKFEIRLGMTTSSARGEDAAFFMETQKNLTEFVVAPLGKSAISTDYERFLAEFRTALFPALRSLDVGSDCGGVSLYLPCRHSITSLTLHGRLYPRAARNDLLRKIRQDLPGLQRFCAGIFFMTPSVIDELAEGLEGLKGLQSLHLRVERYGLDPEEAGQLEPLETVCAAIRAGTVRDSWSLEELRVTTVCLLSGEDGGLP